MRVDGVRNNQQSTNFTSKVLLNGSETLTIKKIGKFFNCPYDAPLAIRWFNVADRLNGNVKKIYRGTRLNITLEGEDSVRITACRHNKISEGGPSYVFDRWICMGNKTLLENCENLLEALTIGSKPKPLKNPPRDKVIHCY